MMTQSYSARSQANTFVISVVGDNLFRNNVKKKKGFGVL